jgi:hypothetical protein
MKTNIKIKNVSGKGYVGLMRKHIKTNLLKKRYYNVSYYVSNLGSVVKIRYKNNNLDNNRKNNLRFRNKNIIKRFYVRDDSIYIKDMQYYRYINDIIIILCEKKDINNIDFEALFKEIKYFKEINNEENKYINSVNKNN